MRSPVGTMTLALAGVCSNLELAPDAALLPGHLPHSQPCTPEDPAVVALAPPHGPSPCPAHLQTFGCGWRSCSVFCSVEHPGAFLLQNEAPPRRTKAVCEQKKHGLLVILASLACTSPLSEGSHTSPCLHAAVSGIRDTGCTGLTSPPTGSSRRQRPTQRITTKP